MNIEELEKLHELMLKGAVSKEEYEKAKAQYFENAYDSSQQLHFEEKYLKLHLVENQRNYIMIMHLSVLLGVIPIWFGIDFIAPWFGLAVPFGMWIYKKDVIEGVNNHGKVIMNWLITMLILFSIFWILKFILIGYLFSAILSLLNIIFSIVGALKAKNGVLWNYPLSIRFFKVNHSTNNIIDHLEK